MTPNAAYSLRRRLLAWLLIATAVIGAAAMADTWNEAVDTANEVSDRVLAGSALAIAERVIVSENGSLEVDIPYVALEMLTSAAQDRVFYRVDGPPGVFITGYQNLPSIPRREGQAVAFENASFRGEPIRVAVLARSASTGIKSVPFVVTVAETTMARQQLTRTILLRSALRLLFMMAGAAVIVWVAVTLSLRPLYRFSEAIAERSPDDLHPIEQQVPSEVQGLVDTVNSFMVRLEGALNALRHFTGNASHQLRTPLAIIRTQLALANRAGTLEEARCAACKADEAVADAERLLAQLLLMAKINAATRSASMQPVDLVGLARSATADHVPQASEAGIDLGFEGEAELGVMAEPLLIGELLKNLIGNALLYAGRGAEVTVRVFRQEEEALLEVEDDGPGIPTEKRASVLARFERGGRTDASGTGLGLPIVEEIARLHGARLSLGERSAGRGLKVQLFFALAGEDPVPQSAR
ncbi:sensor histidine kinase [Neorhizobium lilium]|uniref:histidine kinase n=1 Tax=Neorhizobium lilium TaxID=2503024 RepID=A0A444LEJ8_9HYPH|nr:sensor histidine kinase [Neorhizobium lilium]RWX76555.1 sensor histidine kinase [Neorhizobium lilium]